MQKIKRHGKFCVYMIRDKRGCLYTGYTGNIKKRFAAHKKGFGAKYLRGRGPLQLVFVHGYRYYKNALKAERRIKGYNRAKKEKLVQAYLKSG